MFDFALKSAPNVLLSRYKQYGQVRPAPPDVPLAPTLIQTRRSSACSPGAPSSAR